MQSGTLIVHEEATPETTAVFFIAWLEILVQEQINLSQKTVIQMGNSTKYTFGEPGKKHFTVVFNPATLEWRLVSSSGIHTPDILKVIRKSAAKASSKDLGEDLIYQTELTTSGWDISDPAAHLHFMRILGDQVPISGPRRLSDVVLLDFIEEPEEGGSTFLAAPVRIKVTLFIPGPTGSEFSRRAATGIAEIVAAICALALGRAVNMPAFVGLPLDGKDADEAKKRRHDPSILTLARGGIALDVPRTPAGVTADGIQRLNGSLLSYHAALSASNPDVATILFVTSIEALISPRTEWGKEKVTQRFVKSLLELCPETVEDILNHSNIEEAFGAKKKVSHRKQLTQLLYRIYEARSLPTHAGLGLGSGFIPLGDRVGSLRVALLSDLARAALLSFMHAPRSSLIGHPALDEQAK